MLKGLFEVLCNEDVLGRFAEDLLMKVSEKMSESLLYICFQKVKLN
jgi:hypothetical protein